MKAIIIMLLTGFYTVGSFCQETTSIPSGTFRQNRKSMERKQIPGLLYPDYPQLMLPEKCKDIQLPYMADNSTQPYLRPVFTQMGASCGQAASVGYNFCYEINRARNLPADTSVNQYPDHFVWNFMNATTPYYGDGVSYFHTFDILYDAGNPTEDIYGPITMDDNYYWMNGYDGYFQAMQNRISGVNSIHAGTPEGLQTLKHWLHNHLEGSATGGVANFYAGYLNYLTIPPGTPEAGKFINIMFYQYATHALTIVGYNDSVRYDVNSDGRFTNDLDITGDGIVDMADWEIGALKYVNSYGKDWANSGFCYMLYRALAIPYGEGGIWNNSVHILNPEITYQPSLTIKATIRHNKRGRIRLSAGISADTSRLYPEHTRDFSIFNFQGLDYYMAGNNHQSGKTLEFGLDISSLLSYSKPGSPFRIFLITDEKDPDGSGDGMLVNFSVIDYSGETPEEFKCDDMPVPVVNNGRTITSVISQSDIIPLVISPEGPVLVDSELVTADFSVSGGSSPYFWELKHVYHETNNHSNYHASSGMTLTPTNPENGYSPVPLPFSFPYFGIPYDTIYMHVNGYLMLEKQDMPYYYLLYDEPYLRQVKAIAGYMDHKQFLNSPDDFISVFITDSIVTFNWKISASENQCQSEFSISIYPDGQITCQYGSTVIDAGRYPVIGISNGTQTETIYSSITNKYVPEGKLISFIPHNIPSQISLDSTGVLTIGPLLDSLSGEIIVRVKDAYRLYAEKQIVITRGPEIKIRQADSTLIPKPGDNIPLEIEIRNHGNQTLNNLLVTLSPGTDNLVIIGDMLNGIGLQPGEVKILKNIFSFTLADSISIPQEASIKAVLTSLNSTITKFWHFSASLPVIVSSPPLIADDDQILDPGEEAPVIFNIYNYGNAPTGNLTASVILNDPFTALNGDNTIKLGEFDRYSMKKLALRLKANQSTPDGYIIQIKLEIRDGDHLLSDEVYPLQIGRTSIAVIEMDNLKNSGIHIKTALKQLNVSSDYSESLDSDIFNYKYVFLSLGFFNQRHTLSSKEDSLLVAFLDQGKSLYLEGGAFFKQDPATTLRSRLRVEGSTQAWLHPADSLSGIQASPVEGIQFEYLGDWIRGENLLPVSPAIPWFRDINSGFDFVVALDSGYYKTLASTVEFGGTFPYDGSGRKELVYQYLRFLGYNSNPLSVTFWPETSQICKGSSIVFEPVTSGGLVDYYWSFEGGNPATWKGPFPVIQYNTTGIFNVSLTVSNSSESNTFTLEELIQVYDCAGIEPYPETTFRLYPNPASEVFILESTDRNNIINEVYISDTQGRLVARVSNIKGDLKIIIPLTRFKPGFYLVAGQNNLGITVSKLVVR
ncbi:MAG: T9SS type A sorting domain-containing protein [Bacteroidota bacterium]